MGGQAGGGSNAYSSYSPSPPSRAPRLERGSPRVQLRSLQHETPAQDRGQKRVERPVRIVTGKLRGRNITAPSGKNTRPTSDQTRESIFNILAHADWAPPMDGAIVADIFAGSGALGLEAISRGAAFCLFVETEPKARGAIRENIEKMDLFGCTRIHRHNATKLKIAPGNLRGPFTHIFMDPPYNKGMWRPVLGRLKESGLIAENGVIILEESKDAAIEPRGFEILADKIWGGTRVLFLKIA